MPINAVSSPSTTTATVSSQSQPLRHTNAASQARVSAVNAPASNDRDNDNDTDVQATQRAQEAKPSLNAQGQTVGTTINTTA